MPETHTIASIAKLVKAQLNPQAETAKNHIITDIAPIHRAHSGEITFLTHARHGEHLNQLKASAIIVSRDIPDIETPQLIVQDPAIAMAQTTQLFSPKEDHRQGISSKAEIHETAELHPDCHIYPYAVVDARAQLGPGCVIYPYCYIGVGARIGSRSVLYPGVVVMKDCVIGEQVTIHANTVIGAEGFGFIPSRDGLHKVPQRGNVRIDDGVEIGPVCTIDCATFDSTHIETNAKLDSHVHVGHNVQVGESSLLCGQVGIAGSAKIGANSILAGHAGVSPGVELGKGVRLGAKTAAIKNLPDAGDYLGMPPTPARQWARQQALLSRLPQMNQRIKDLEQKIKALGRTQGDQT